MPLRFSACFVTRYFGLVLIACMALSACKAHAKEPAQAEVKQTPATASASDEFAKEREEMVREQIAERGVTDLVVLRAMRETPRHLFVPDNLRSSAYADQPLPIGYGQTISQPYIVALMTDLLELRPTHRVLEIGTGSGYQAAVLSKITPEVYTIEIVKPLHETAKDRLSKFGLDPARVIHGDGYFGLPDKAPFDGIIVTAAADHIPPPLIQQLKPGGRMVIPIGPAYLAQRLVVVEKSLAGKVTTRSTLPVRFVPLTGGQPKP
jgi:protein-L-isoaspartate(D-aspartate) O-methyltransferase